MREQVDRLTKLATDLLDLSRLDAGRLHVEREPVDLGALARSLARSSAPSARAEPSSTRTASTASARSRDEQRVLQIGRILVENALRHTPAGTEIRLATAATGDGVELRVEDTGPGIPPDDQQQVFERFYRVDGAVAPRAAGLGLAIARELAELMGGEIELDSRPGSDRLHVETAEKPADRRGARAARPFERSRPPAVSRANEVGYAERRGYSERVREPRRSCSRRDRRRRARRRSPSLAASRTGWLDGGLDETVFVRGSGVAPRRPARCPWRGDRASRQHAKPLPGNGFDPAAIYAARSTGRGHDLRVLRRPTTAEQAAQGSGFVVSPEGYILTNAHVITTAGRAERASRSPPTSVYVEFRTATGSRRRSSAGTSSTTSA